jgi:hypothetical protein
MVAVVVAVASVMGACALDDVSKAVRENRRQFRVVMESKMRQLDRGIAHLNGASQSPDTVRVGDVANLKRNQQALRVMLASVDGASDAEWPALRDSLENCYHGVRSQYDALAHYGARVEQAVADSSGGDGSAQR